MTWSYDRLRTCAGCSADILTEDGRSEMVFCRKCRPKHVKPFDEWSAGLKVGDQVYLQPYLAWRGLSHSHNVIVERDGDQLTVQIIGIPESRQTTTVGQCAQHDMTPRSLGGAAG